MRVKGHKGHSAGDILDPARKVAGCRRSDREFEHVVGGFCRSAGRSAVEIIGVARCQERPRRQVADGCGRLRSAPSILIIVWHLLNDPAARYHAPGPDWHARHTDRSRKARNARSQIEAPATTSSSPSGRTPHPPGGRRLTFQHRQPHPATARPEATRHRAMPPSARTAVTLDGRGGYLLVSPISPEQRGSQPELVTIPVNRGARRCVTWA